MMIFLMELALNDIKIKEQYHPNKSVEELFDQIENTLIFFVVNETLYSRTNSNHNIGS